MTCLNSYGCAWLLGILPILLHPPSTEADRVKAIKDRWGPERSERVRCQASCPTSLNIDPSAMSPVKPRLSETGGRKSCGSGKEWKEKGSKTCVGKARAKNIQIPFKITILYENIVLYFFFHYLFLSWNFAWNHRVFQRIFPMPWWWGRKMECSFLFWFFLLLIK